MARREDDDEEVGAAGVDGLVRLLPGIEESVPLTGVTCWPQAVLVAEPETYGGLRRFQERYPQEARLRVAADYAAARR